MNVASRKRRRKETNAASREPIAKKRKTNKSRNQEVSIQFHPMPLNTNSLSVNTLFIPFTFQNASNATILIGADNSKCKVICNHPNVLPIHAEVSYDEDHDIFFIKALDSEKNVFVNECKLDDLHFALKDNDIIQIGKASTDTIPSGITNQYQIEIIGNDTNILRETNANHNAKQWICAVCTLRNDDPCNICRVCGCKPDCCVQTMKKQMHQRQHNIALVSGFKRTINQSTCNHNMNMNIRTKTSANNVNTMSFIPHMTLEAAAQLQRGDTLDHRDSFGKFYKAQVMDKQNTLLTIHYTGYDHSFDVSSDYQKQLHCFAKAGSIAQRNAHRLTHLRERDFVDINPIHSSGWKYGQIVDFDGGQIQVSYVMDDKMCIYWSHLDNSNEIAAAHTFGAFVPHMKLWEVQTLKHGDVIDVRNKCGYWFGASVIANQHNKITYKLSIHSHEWDRKYNQCTDYRQDRFAIFRFAKYGSISMRNSKRFQALNIGDYVDINPKSMHPGWTMGQIKNINNGQMRIEYEYKSTKYVQWVHQDDEEEVADPGSFAFSAKRTTTDRFYESVRRSDFEIKSIFCVSNNNEIYEAILNKKLGQQNKSRNEIEMFLWHGTAFRNLEYIIKNGFDRSFNTNSKLGKGTYFAKNVSYSVINGFCPSNRSNGESSQVVLLCKVIVGDYTIGHPNNQTIPKKPDGSEYDTMVNNLKDPTLFVVWRDYHAVPYCVVRFVSK